MKKLLAFLSILILFTSAPIRAALPQYVIHDLGTFGGASACAGAVNNHGQVVGYVRYSQYEYRAFLWDGQGYDIGPGIARGINESGVVAGDVAGYMPGYTADGFTWDGQRHDVPEGCLYAINNSGMVVGQVQSNYHAFALSNGTFRDIHYPGAGTSMAMAVNDNGVVVVNCVIGGYYDSHDVAFIWDGTDHRRLGTLGGENTYATDINNAGQVTGWSDTVNMGDAGFLWDDTMHNIGYGLHPHAINEHGWIVGEGLRDAFVYADGITQYLPTLGGTSTNAVAINDFGVIAGIAWAADGAGHAVLWEPVPEPGTALVLLSGLTGCATLRLRARRTRG